MTWVCLQVSVTFSFWVISFSTSPTNSDRCQNLKILETFIEYVLRMLISSTSVFNTHSARRKVRHIDGYLLTDL